MFDRSQLARHVAAGMVVTAVSVGLGTAMNKQPKMPSTFVAQQVSAKWSWGALTETEQAAIAKAIGDLNRREVEIFCGSSGCDDLAQDIDEVFDLTHATSTVRKPVLDLVAMAGIGIQPLDDDTKRIASAFTNATGGRITIKVLDNKVSGGGIQVLIASKPRH